MAFLSKKADPTAAQTARSLEKKIHQLMQLSKYDRALFLLEKLLEENSALTTAELDTFYQYYGECLVQSCRLEEAIHILSKGPDGERQSGTRCRETLEELVIPAVEKKIMESSSVEEAVQLLKSLDTTATETTLRRTTQAFLRMAAEAYRLKDYQRALEAYEWILPFSEKHRCIEFEDYVRAGDSHVKCGQLNKAWKIYETAKEYSETFNQTCRLHKKIADLLVMRNQDWHAILHFLVALQAVPSDKGAKTKLQKVLKKLGLEHYTNMILQLNTKHSDHKQLEISLMNLKKKLKPDNLLSVSCIAET